MPAAHDEVSALIAALHAEGWSSLGTDDVLRLTRLWPHLEGQSTAARVSAITALLARGEEERALAAILLPRHLGEPAPSNSAPPTVDFERLAVPAPRMPFRWWLLAVGAPLALNLTVFVALIWPWLVPPSVPPGPAPVPPEAGPPDAGLDAGPTRDAEPLPDRGAPPAPIAGGPTRPPPTDGQLPLAWIDQLLEERDDLRTRPCPPPTEIDPLAPFALLGLGVALLLAGLALREPLVATARVLEALATSTGPRAPPRRERPSVRDPLDAARLARLLETLGRPPAQGGRRDLDPRATVAATVRAQGRIELRYRSRVVAHELLLLVDASAAMSRWPFHAAQVERALRSAGHRVTRRYYDARGRLAAHPDGPFVEPLRLGVLDPRSAVVFGLPPAAEVMDRWVEALPAAHLWLHPRPRELWSRAARGWATRIRMVGVGEDLDTPAQEGRWHPGGEKGERAAARDARWRRHLGEEGFALLCLMAAIDRADAVCAEDVWWLRARLREVGLEVPWDRVERLWERPGLTARRDGAIVLDTALRERLASHVDALPREAAGLLAEVGAHIAARLPEADANSLGGAELRLGVARLGIADPASRPQASAALRVLEQRYGALVGAALTTGERAHAPPMLGRRVQRVALTLGGLAFVGGLAWLVVRGSEAPTLPSLVGVPHLAEGHPLTVCRGGGGGYLAALGLRPEIEVVGWPIEVEAGDPAEVSLTGETGRGRMTQLRLSLVESGAVPFARLPTGPVDVPITVGATVTLTEDLPHEAGSPHRIVLDVVEHPELVADLEGGEPRWRVEAWVDGAWMELPDEGGIQLELQDPFFPRDGQTGFRLPSSAFYRRIAFAWLSRDGRPFYSPWMAVAGTVFSEPDRTEPCPDAMGEPFGRNDPICAQECIAGTVDAVNPNATEAARARCRDSLGATRIQRVSTNASELRWRVAIDDAFSAANECRCVPATGPTPDCEPGTYGGSGAPVCEDATSAGRVEVVRRTDREWQWIISMPRPQGLRFSCRCEPRSPSPSDPPPAHLDPILLQLERAVLPEARDVDDIPHFITLLERGHEAALERQAPPTVRIQVLIERLEDVVSELSASLRTHQDRAMRARVVSRPDLDCELSPVYFGYEAPLLSDAANQLVQSNVRCLEVQGRTRVLLRALANDPDPSRANERAAALLAILYPRVRDLRSDWSSVTAAMGRAPRDGLGNRVEFGEPSAGTDAELAVSASSCEWQRFPRTPMPRSPRQVLSATGRWTVCDRNECRETAAEGSGAAPFPDTAPVEERFAWGALLVREGEFGAPRSVPESGILQVSGDEALYLRINDGDCGDNTGSIRTTLSPLRE